MNILKRIQILVLVLAPACLMGMEQPFSVQYNVLSAVESGINAVLKENQNNLVIPITSGGIVAVMIEPYEYGSEFNSCRDKNRDADILACNIAKLTLRYKISITIDGVSLNSLDWLNQIFGSNEESELRLFFHQWLYSLSIHNSKITTLHGSWFSLFKNLEILDLAHNNIVGFDEADFRLPKTLQSIDLSENNITNIPTKLFQQRLQWIESLNLSKNHLNQLSSKMFSGLIFLNSLNLSHNYIAFLPDNVFNNVGEVFNHFRLNVNLYNNPILNTFQQVDMNKLGFSKRKGNKVIFDCINDGQSTPRNIYLEL